MRTKVQKWGNSLALRIPKPFALETRLQPDSVVDVALIDGKLVISPELDLAFTLDGLLSEVTDENCHGEVETGPSVGHEVW